MKQSDIEEVLKSVVHPETGESIAEGGIKNLSVADDSVRFTIVLKRVRDPFASAVKREAIRRITEVFPQTEGRISITIEEPAVKPHKKPDPRTSSEVEGIGRVIAVASGKGGVGKSTVTANLAVTLVGMGYRVGILDADIYGPSQPSLFGVADYRPQVESVGGVDHMKPVISRGVKIMSIGFFIDPSDALVWRGPMATSALKQMINQTQWGALDFLLIDLPPGTGDVHLTMLQEMKVNGAVIVSTPQQIALADVVRGIAMFRAEKIGVEVLGIVENMAWFTPAELPSNRYYIFGRGRAVKLAVDMGLPLLGQIPLILPSETAIGGGLLWNVDNKTINDAYIAIAHGIIKE